MKIEKSPHTNKTIITIRKGKIVVIKPLKQEKLQLNIQHIKK